MNRTEASFLHTLDAPHGTDTPIAGFDVDGPMGSKTARDLWTTYVVLGRDAVVAMPQHDVTTHKPVFVAPFAKAVRASGPWRQLFSERDLVVQVAFAGRYAFALSDLGDPRRTIVVRDRYTGASIRTIPPSDGAFRTDIFGNRTGVYVIERLGAKERLEHLDRSGKRSRYGFVAGCERHQSAFRKPRREYLRGRNLVVGGTRRIGTRSTGTERRSAMSACILRSRRSTHAFDRRTRWRRAQTARRCPIPSSMTKERRKMAVARRSSSDMGRMVSCSIRRCRQRLRHFSSSVSSSKSRTFVVVVNSASDGTSPAKDRRSNIRSMISSRACGRLRTPAGRRPQSSRESVCSAGGITIGGAITQHPELFAVAISQVGFSDMVDYENMPNGPGNVPEFGSVKTPNGFRNLLAMSAYDHVVPAPYPATILTTGLADQRDSPWQVAKMAARLQASTTSGKPVLLRADSQGHGLVLDPSAQVDEYADVWTFMLWQLGEPGFQPAT